MRDCRLYLHDMIAAVESIETFTEGMEFEAFKTDDKTVSAVLLTRISGLGAFQNEHVFRLCSRPLLDRNSRDFPSTGS